MTDAGSMPILTSEADYQAALHDIRVYFDAEPAPGTAEAARFDALAAAVERYEARHYPLHQATIVTPSDIVYPAANEKSPRV